MATRRRERPDPRLLAEVALRYVQHGWPVLPIHTPGDRGCSCPARDCGSPGKHPRTARGLHDASTEVDRIRGWWARWPNANIGVVTGAPSGLVVLDVDLPDGPDSLATLQAVHGRLPVTCEQTTGSGGRQLLFAYPDVTVGNRARLRPGLDVRGDGGYIVVPPSIHATGGRYQWAGRLPPAAPPDWLLALLDRSHPPQRAPAIEIPDRLVSGGGRELRYATAALRRELAGLAAAVEGTRNATLNRAAFSLGQLVATGLLDRDRVAAELERVAADIGLGPAEVRRTVASGLTAGLTQPRAIPARTGHAESRTPPSVSAPVRRLGARRR